MKLQDFDRNDLRNVGRPNFFDVDMYLLMIEQMITCDEVEKAMWMLDNMPAYYRDNVPHGTIRIKEQLFKKFFTTADYADMSPELFNEASRLSKEAVQKEFKSIIRFYKIYEVVRQLNEAGITPHIIEYGPGGFAIPYGLNSFDLRYTYFAQGLNVVAINKVKNTLPQWTEELGAYNIFVCYEVIEHLTDVGEIYHFATKHCSFYDRVLISTPKYTWAGGFPDWYNRDLGHLRTYTPRDLLSFGMKYWPHLKWGVNTDYELVLEGMLDG